ncbi:Alpha/Beta hydrolase protein [Hypoxylon trugodes]|uniref:Alpha/Beta hydrolase protein n=1 Tax=Hypoxylon trugodes TaxID=326681 RepID=UPI00218EE068|nr:Alpha/Beta hydrolase protein [Hypoxylon trugodes]KAI1389686.1 Alpha/Beta hydrolase protein [Hypoxylon trugodes]
MAPLFSRQPFKGLYIIYFVLKLLPLSVFYSIRFSFNAFRPIREWNFTICFVNAICKHVFHYMTVTRTTGLDGVLSDQKKAGSRYTLVNPADSRTYTSVLAQGLAQPATVGGIWFPNAPPKQIPPGQKVILHIPGGAFVLAFGTQEFGQVISEALIPDLGVGASYMFFPQYRISDGSPKARFPAAVQDILTVYLYILSLGVSPKDVILSGDSAGGNLALALLRYLEDQNVHPLPGAAMAWSPWIHVTHAAVSDYDSYPNAQRDVLVRSLLQWGVESYIPSTPLARYALPYISPLHHPFKTSVPLWLCAGTGEALHEQVRSFAQEMVAENDEHLVRFHGAPLASHGLIQAHKTIGMTKELREAIADAREFFEENGV